MKPTKIATLKSDPAIHIWRFGTKPNDPACISEEPPADDKQCRPLQALVAHLQLSEWEYLL